MKSTKWLDKPFQPGHLGNPAGYPAPWTKERSEKGLALAKKATAAKKVVVKVPSNPWDARK